ncbi:MAG TPA: hypothetical protein VH477_00675 [Bryobacteraceae bacterium]|jgi:hypothetical protein
MSSPSVAPPPLQPPKLMRWQRRVLGLCLIVFAFEIGLFLLVFPWLSVWGMNWVPVHSKHLAGIWMSPYFRGVVSGLGLLNIFVALAETLKQLRSLFAHRPNNS